MKTKNDMWLVAIFLKNVFFPSIVIILTWIGNHFIPCKNTTEEIFTYISDIWLYFMCGNLIREFKEARKE